MLPYAGGLLDQPVGVLERMMAAETVYIAVSDWRNASDWVAWKQRYPERWTVVCEVLRLREEGHAG